MIIQKPIVVPEPRGYLFRLFSIPTNLEIRSDQDQNHQNGNIVRSRWKMHTFKTSNERPAMISNFLHLSQALTTPQPLQKVRHESECIVAMCSPHNFEVGTVATNIIDLAASWRKPLQLDTLAAKVSSEGRVQGMMYLSINISNSHKTKITIWNT